MTGSFWVMKEGWVIYEKKRGYMVKYQIDGKVRG